MQYFENELTDFGANWHQCFTRQGHEMVDFGSQDVKSQGYTRLKKDLDPGKDITLNTIFLVSLFWLSVSWQSVVPVSILLGCDQ